MQTEHVKGRMSINIEIEDIRRVLTERYSSCGIGLLDLCEVFSSR